MKVLLLLGLLLACASARTNWDLKDVSHNLAGANQGYKARHIRQGKSLKLSLPVHKENEVRVTDTDRLLFGMEETSAEHQAIMANTTVSHKDTAALCARALGPNWQKSVHLPKEELSYIENMRLASSLNEFNLLASGSEISKSRRSSYGSEHEHEYPSDFDCVCHGTNHRFPWSEHGGPYWGVRVLQRHTAVTAVGHSYHGSTDCLLCYHGSVAQADTADGFEYDCRWCCYGECVVLPTGANIVGGWQMCDVAFEFDSLRTDSNQATYNFYRINDVGSCRLPRVYHCVEEVTRLCITCEPLLDAIMGDSDSDSDFLQEFAACDYCNLVVGANPHICTSCANALENIQEYGANTGFRGGDECTCDNAMWQIANSDRYNHHEGDNHEGDNHESHEGDHYESHDYDYNRNDYGYDYGRNDYDYNRNSDYDYNRNDYGYDYGRNDYDYDYNRNEGHESHEGDHYESHDYDYNRNSDYDYGRNDYDYRTDYRNDYDYNRNSDYDYNRNSDYDYGRNDYDYRRPSDYNYGYESHESHESYDYGRNDYDYDYNRNDYDFDFRADYNYESHENHESHEGDHYESNDYDYNRNSDYDYGRNDYDYRRPSNDYGYESHESHESYDYGRNDYGYDYGRNDYDYNYRG